MEILPKKFKSSYMKNKNIQKIREIKYMNNWDNYHIGKNKFKKVIFK